MKSLNEKIVQAFELSYKIHLLLEGGTIPEGAIDDMDLVYGHADGLVAKRLYNIRGGRCSVQASLNFDPEKEEDRLDDDISYFTKLIEEAE